MNDEIIIFIKNIYNDLIHSELFLFLKYEFLSLEYGYLCAIFKLIILTHVLPLSYATCQLILLKYIKRYIVKRTGRPVPEDYEEMLTLYYDLREEIIINEWDWDFKNTRIQRPKVPEWEQRVYLYPIQTGYKHLAEPNNERNLLDTYVIAGNLSVYKKFRKQALSKYSTENKKLK